MLKASDEWTVSRRYFSLESLAKLTENPRSYTATRGHDLTRASVRWGGGCRGGGRHARRRPLVRLHFCTSRSMLVEALRQPCPEVRLC